MATGRIPTTANSPLTTKGDLFGYSTTQARVAVGSDGDTLVADSAASAGLRWQAQKGRNICYNSGFQVWQRGTSFTVPTASGEYTADRWYAAFSGITGRTLSRQSGTAQFPYLMRVARNSGNTATNALQVGQSWEIQDATPYAGQTITISYYARKGANYSATSNALSVSFFTGTSSTEANRITTAYASGDTQALGATTTLTDTLTRYSHTITLGSSVTQFALTFTFTPTGTAGANDWFEITGVQVEVGSVPTTWNSLGGTLQGELAACQRYYYRFGGDTNVQAYGQGIGESTTAAGIFIQHPVPMRIAASSVDYSTLRLSDWAASNYAVTSLTISSTNNGKNGVVLSAGVASGLTANRPYFLFSANSASGYLGFSAEL